MKYIMSESQVRNLKKKLLIENDENVIDLNQPIDLSKYNSLGEIIRAVKSLGLRHRKGTQSRGKFVDVNNLLRSLEGISDKRSFDKYIKIMMEMVSKYKSESYTIKKIYSLLDSILSMDESEMFKKMDDIINLYDDDRFEERHKKDLFKELEKSNVNFDDFYKKTVKKFREYELSFIEGESTPFVSFFTSPRLTVNLSKDLNYLNVNVSKNEFNGQSSDVNKVNYLISKLAEVKSFSKKPNEIIKEMISMISFGISFNFSDRNVKADLKLVKDLINFDSKTMRTSVISKTGKDVEIKNNVYNKPYYLSEFFKIDSTKENESYLLNSLSMVPKIEDVKNSFKIFMESLVDNLRRNLLSSQVGDEIINHLTNNLSGMIFSNSIYIPIEYITFYWNNVGYANKPRLSIYYEVMDNPVIYRLTKRNGSYDQYLEKVSR